MIIPLGIVFGISLVIFLYMAGYSWYLGGLAVNQSIPWLYSSAVISGASLFILSNIYYSKRHKGYSAAQRYLLSTFDLTAYFCVIVLVLWGLVLPILHPINSPDFQLYLFGQKSLTLGLYTGLVLGSLVVVFRGALQFLITRSSNTVMIIQAPKTPQLASLSETKEKKSLEDSLSLIRSEIAMLREEISSLSTGRVWTKSAAAPNPSEDNSWSMGDSDAISFPFSQMRASASAPPVQERTITDGLTSNAGVQKAVPFAQEYEPTTGDIQLPDSARDNPWASVLSMREARISIPSPPPVVQQPEEKETKKPAATTSKKSRRSRSNKKSEAATKPSTPVPEIADPQLTTVPPPTSQETKNP